MSYRIRAVEHRLSGDGLAGAHPGLKNRILINYTRIENAHKVRMKTFDFVVIYTTPANVLFSFFPAETQLLFLSSCNSSVMLQKSVGLMQLMWAALALISLSRQNKCNFSNKVTYRRTQS